jgi:endonuclease YncB( thermonuclease family)
MFSFTHNRLVGWALLGSTIGVFFIRWQMLVAFVVLAFLLHVWRSSDFSYYTQMYATLGVLVMASFVLHQFQYVHSAALAGEFGVEGNAAMISYQQRESEFGVVVEVIDGDSIIVEYADGSRREIRYIGIDTPEIVAPLQRHQCYGHEALRANEELTFGQEVELVREVSDVDPYGRDLRHVYVDGELVAAQLLANGYARVLSFAPDVSLREEFLRIEAQAQSDQIGGWSKSCFNR